MKSNHFNLYIYVYLVIVGLIRHPVKRCENNNNNISEEIYFKLVKIACTWSYSESKYFARRKREA
jgi:hypothetical protein